MTIDRYTKILMTVFTVAVLLNIFNPWIDPPSAGAKESAEVSGGSNDTDCSAALKNSIKNREVINSLERLLGYIESSVNEVKVTVHGIDRKVNEMPSLKSADRR